MLLRSGLRRGSLDVGLKIQECLSKHCENMDKANPGACFSRDYEGLGVDSHSTFSVSKKVFAIQMSSFPGKNSINYIFIFMFEK